MVIGLAHRPDLERRVEKLADSLDLKGRGRRTETIEQALALVEERVAQDRPDRAAVKASLDRCIANGSDLLERLVLHRDGRLPLPIYLQQELCDYRRLPG